MGSAWQLYDELIEGVDAGERVLGMCEGSHWTCVEASCGTGVAATCKGGGRERLSPLAGKPLRDVAALAKSWDFETASVGVAALNAWYNQPSAEQSVEDLCRQRNWMKTFVSLNCRLH